jgi:hypothetical protein
MGALIVLIFAKIGKTAKFVLVSFAFGRKDDLQVVDLYRVHGFHRNHVKVTSGRGGWGIAFFLLLFFSFDPFFRGAITASFFPRQARKNHSFALIMRPGTVIIGNGS